MVDVNGRLIAGRYRLIEPLGSGGMGQVWKARDETLSVDVAVKEVRLDAVVGRDEAIRRALAEARNAAALRDHPNIVAVHDAVLEEGVPWTVMRLVDGRSLAEELEARGVLHPDEVARIAAGVISALAAAHAAGIIHRDVKPANIMIERSGTVLLADFGIAKNHADTALTATGAFIGSLEYIAPERLNGAGDTPAVDLFGLGATLYEAVEGTSPFRRATPSATMAAIAFEPLPVPQQAGRLTPLITALLGRSPEARPDATTALEADLDTALAGRTVTDFDATALIADGTRMLAHWLGPARARSRARMLLTLDPQTRELTKATAAAIVTDLQALATAVFGDPDHGSLLMALVDGIVVDELTHGPEPVDTERLRARFSAIASLALRA